VKLSRGLSLLEVLIGITVAGVAGMLLINLMVSSNNIFFNQSIQINQGLSLNQALKEIGDSVKLSAGTEAQYPPSGVAQYTTGSGQLVLKLPAIDASGQVIDSVYDYVVIAKDSSNPRILRKHIFVTSPSVRKAENKVLSTSLDSLTFQYFDASNAPVSPSQAVRLEFIINLSSQAGQSDKESSGSGVVNFKNL
jgi:hypothetical protein